MTQAYSHQRYMEVGVLRHNNSQHNIYSMDLSEKNLSPSQGLNLSLPNTSQMLLPLGIGAENITTSVVILIVYKSILY